MSKEMRAAIIGAVITGIFAIIAACIGGPLIVELLFGSKDDSVVHPSPTSHQQVAVATNTPSSAVMTATMETGAQSAAPQPTSTPAGIRNPTGPVAAGIPILADDLSLLVQDGFDTYGDKVGITLVVKNTGGRTRLLRFQCSAIGLMDNRGNVYRSQGDGKEELYATRQIELAPGEVVVLEPANTWGWASVSYIPRFVGPISPEATKLTVLVDGLGPFAGIEVEIDL